MSLPADDVLKRLTDLLMDAVEKDPKTPAEMLEFHLSAADENALSVLVLNELGTPKPGQIPQAIVDRVLLDGLRATFKTVFGVPVVYGRNEGATSIKPRWAASRDPAA
jgi:hypothetical protein